MEIPTLVTDRLRLVPPSAACEPVYLAFYTDAAASHHYGGPLTAEAALARLASDRDNWARQGFGVWAVVLRSDEAVIGTCGFWQGAGWPRELTWWLLPSARGQAIAVEASLAAIRHAYDAFGWPEVQTYMNDDNVAARKLVLRLGGEIVGRQGFPDGLERDVFRIPRPADTPVTGLSAPPAKLG